MKNKPSVKLDHNHHISLGSELCQQIGLKPGDELLLDKQGDLLILQPKPQDIVTYLAGLHYDVWQNINPQEYLHEERDQWRDFGN